MSEQKICRIKDGTWADNRLNKYSLEEYRLKENCILACYFDARVDEIAPALRKIFPQENPDTIQKYTIAIAAFDCRIPDDLDYETLQELAQRLNVKLIIEK